MSAPATGVERRTTRALIREFEPQFAGELPSTRLRAYIREAVDDLRGSVSPEALPEMAARLAHHRMTRAALHRDGALLVSAPVAAR
jgi:hypothetical protein